MRCIKESFDLQRTYREEGDNKEEIARNIRQFKDAESEIEQTLKTLEELDNRQEMLFSSKPFYLFSKDDDVENDRLNNKNVIAVTKDVLDKLKPILSQTSDVKLQQFNNVIEQSYDEIFGTLIQAAIDNEVREADEGNRAIDLFSDRIKIICIVLVLVTVVFLGYILKNFVRSMLNSLSNLTHVAEAFKHGDFSERAQVSGDDELAEFGETFNLMADKIVSNQAVLLAASKMSALGEMAGGIAHEINNPLGVISARSSQIKRLIQKTPVDLANIEKFADAIEKTTMRIANIISGLRSFSRNAEKDPFQNVPLEVMVQDTLALCIERFKHHSIQLTVDDFDKSLMLECRPTQVVQVLVNLLNNAFDAIADGEGEKWVRVSVTRIDKVAEIRITDRRGPKSQLSAVFYDQRNWPRHGTRA